MAAAPTREDAAWFLTYIARLQIGRYPIKERLHEPTIEDMRLIYLAWKTLDLMSKWTMRSERLKRENAEQAALLKGWLDGLMEGGKMKDGLAMVIDANTSETLNKAADAVIEYDLKDQAEKKRK